MSATDEAAEAAPSGEASGALHGAGAAGSAGPGPAPPAAGPAAALAEMGSRRTRAAALIEVMLAAGAYLGDAISNLRTALALLLRPGPQPDPPEGLRASGGQLFALYVLALLLGLAYDAYAVGWQGGRLDLFSLPALSFWALSALLAAWWIASIDGRPERFLPLATAAFALVCWESFFAYALAIAADRVALLDRFYVALSWVPLVWAALAFAVFALRLSGSGGRARRGLIALVALTLLLAPQWAVNPAARLWATASSVDREVIGPDAPQSEQTLYGQIDLLEDALDAIEPGQAGVTELFTISFAGDGTQDVFLNEANGADAVMAEAFGSADHALVLANNAAHPQERPFASVSALQRALATMADRMNPEEDVLALVLTSHGTPDHHLVVSMPPYALDDLTPERLRTLLDEAGIRFRVIIVSACYAGGFVEPLAGDDTMVIAASQADRTSFGCRDGARWTDFGQAFFSEALTQTASFEGAFRLASQRIGAREAKEGLTPSQPQIFVGPGIREQLQRLETRRGGKILFAQQSASRKLP